MLSTELSLPIYVSRQLTEISEKSGIPMKQIWQLTCFCHPMLGVVYEDCDNYKKGELIELEFCAEENDSEEGSDSTDVADSSKKEKHYSERTDLDDVLYYKGFEAIEWLCREKGIDIKPIRKIDLPMHLFYNCDSEQWYDICESLASVDARNGRFERLSRLGLPLIIWSNEARLLYEAVDFLECGKIGGGEHRWHHGRMIRGLNDMGYSLIEGYLKVLDWEEIRDSSDPYVKKERRGRMNLYEKKWYLAHYREEGESAEDALLRAIFATESDQPKRGRSIEGMGIWLKESMERRVLLDFLGNHKSAFIQSEKEQRIFDRLKEVDSLHEVFSPTEDDAEDETYTYWGEAVANVMSRETGLRFEVFYAHPSISNLNRSCILFPERPVWDYNEKERKLSRNMLYQILDRYALELQHSVSTKCYYIIGVNDYSSVNPQGL